MVMYPSDEVSLISPVTTDFSSSGMTGDTSSSGLHHEGDLPVPPHKRSRWPSKSFKRQPE